jgi:HK97 family phage prohead protease
MKEIRDYLEGRGEVRATPQGGETVISGYASVFDTPTELFPGFQEVVKPGAFTESLARGDTVTGLFNHDPNFPLASTPSKTLRLWQDDQGLGYEMRDAFTPTVRDLVVEPIRKGIVRGSSFGFVVEEETFERLSDGVDLREIRSARLIDVSPVTFPAYPETEATVRAELRRRLDTWGTPVDHQRRSVALLDRELRLRQRP